MKPYEIIGLFLFGTIWGSFFYTLAIRFYDGSIEENPLKALFTSSKCPHCKANINPIYLFPILGYLFLRGKCNKCKNKIHISYPLYEIVYGILLLVIVDQYNITIYALDIFLLLGLSISMAIIDVKIMKIPNSLIVVFLLLSIYPILLNSTIKDNVYGFLMMSSVFIIIMLIFPGSFGGGDAKFASAIGLLTGLEFSIVVLETALVSGAVIGLIYAVITRKGLKIKIPFAPFLVFGLIFTILFGRDIVLLYHKYLNNY